MAGREMAFASARRAEQQKIGTLFEPAITSGERHYLRLADHRDAGVPRGFFFCDGNRGSASIR
jgi:hypothetical protein